MSYLPPAEHQAPACGTCGCETWHDGEDFICDDCQLRFVGDELEASFLDPDAKPCGRECDNTWHADNAIKPGVGHRCRPCQLPAGHTSLHWTGCPSVTLTAETAQ